MKPFITLGSIRRTRCSWSQNAIPSRGRRHAPPIPTGQGEKLSGPKYLHGFDKVISVSKRDRVSMKRGLNRNIIKRVS